MKGVFISNLFCLLGLICALSSFAQVKTADTIAYTIGQYTVNKKAMSAADIAQKLKVDPRLVVKLNNFANEKEMLSPGVSIAVPVYANGYKYQVKTVLIKEKKRLGAGNKNNADTATIAVPATPALSPVDFELQKNRLLLIDATLELNETLLQGVKASLDSLNVDDKSPLNEKNMQVTVRRMERQRDRVLLKPYLAHIQDSLKTEVMNLEKEKNVIEATLSSKQLQDVNVEAGITTPGPPTPEVTGKDTVSPQANNVALNNAGDNQPVSIHAPVEVNNDTSKTVAVVASGPPQEESQAENKPHWTTAKALPEVSENVFVQKLMEVPSLPENKTEPVRTDTAAYTARNKTLPVQPGEIKSISVIKVDSVALLKSQLFYTKAVKAWNDGNTKLAEELFQQAIDLNPGYYDAWFQLADLHLQNSYPAKALNEFKICQSIDSSSYRLFYKMGNAAYRCLQRDVAYNYFQRCLDIDSNYAPAIMGRAQMLADRKQYDLAIKEFTHVLTINVAIHTAYKSRGIAEYRNNNFGAAIDDFTTYLLFDDKDGGSYYFRGLCELALKQRTEACTDLHYAVQLKYEPAIRTLEKNCAGAK